MGQTLAGRSNYGADILDDVGESFIGGVTLRRSASRNAAAGQVGKYASFSIPYRPHYGRRFAIARSMSLGA
jgi:hypothetical protein